MKELRADVSEKLKKNEELLKKRAYDKTREASRNFLRMLYGQEVDDKSEQDEYQLERFSDKFKRALTEKSLDMNVVYRKFMKKFWDMFEEKVTLNSQKDISSLIRSMYVKDISPSVRRMKRG